MNAREERKIIVTASPNELRALADKMEKRWPKLLVGDSTFVDFLFHGEGIRIDLHLDQEWFNKNKPKH